MDTLAKRLYQYALGAIVILLAVVFALQFGGPQAQGCSTGGATFAARVHGVTLTEGDFRATYALAGCDRVPIEVARREGCREHVMNGLIERELLARAASDVGFSVDDDTVMEKLATDGTVYLSLGVDAPPSMPSGEIPVPVKNRDGDFDVEAAKRFIQYGLRRSVTEFGEAQIKETLAARMRDTVLATVTISPEEVWDAFRRERDTATIEYVRFAPAYYRESLVATPDDIRAWMAENEEAVDREYQANRHRYVGLEKQVRARHVLIKIEADASDEVKAAARARADQILARARAGEDFAALAREASEDPGSARAGGDLGYNPRGRMVAPFDEAQFSLEPGQISDVVESQFGFHVIKVEGVREGDVPEEEAKLELAERLYREARATELAREAATRALETVRGGATMEDLDRELSGRTEETEATDEAEEDADPLAPRVREAGPFGRADAPIPGVSDNGPVVRAAFELADDARVPEELVEAGGDFFVIRLKDRETVSRDDMEAEVATRIREGLLAAKRREAIRLYVHELRRAAEAEGAIRVNEALLSYDEEASAPEEEGN